MNKREYIKSTIDLIQNNYAQVFVIHYSCESFVGREAGNTPRISSIAIRNLNTNQTVSFSIHLTAEALQVPLDNIVNEYDRLEREMLNGYFSFLKRHHTNSYFVHWNMRDVNYGFEAINQRYRALRGDPIDIDDSRKIDLANLLIVKFGPDYIDHPRLQSIIDLNGISRMHFLSGAEEANAFVNGNYLEMHLSTLRKVECLVCILDRFLHGRLKTKANRFAQFINNCFEHWGFRLLTIVLSVYAVIQIVMSFFK